MPRYIVIDDCRFQDLWDRITIKQYLTKKRAVADNPDCEVLLVNKRNILDTLDELLRVEHTGGCNNTTCSIDIAHKHGYLLHALYCFDGSGASSETFDLLYAELNRFIKDMFKESMKEAGLMCKEIPHAECPHCNAVTWSYELCEDEEWQCESCHQEFLPKLEE